MLLKKKVWVIQDSGLFRVLFRKASLYYINFLITGCPALVNLPALPTSMSCHITDTCTKLDCCVDVDKLGLSLNAYIILDTCNNRFTVGVDKFSRTISLLNVDFGKLEIFSFLGLFKIG